MGDGPQKQNFVVGEAGNIVDGSHIDSWLPPLVGQAQVRPGDEDKVSQLELRDLAHHDLVIQVAV